MITQSRELFLAIANQPSAVAENGENSYVREKRYARIDALQFPVMAWKDLERLEYEAREAAILGYAGKIAIHPDQIPVLNRVFSPTPEQIERARAVIAHFEQTQESGGAIIKHDSQTMDAPHVKQATNVLEKARRAGII